MKKIVKEINKPLLWIDIVLYIIITIVGAVLLRYPELEVLKPTEYMVFVFFGIGFFSLIAYFSNRRNDDYEFLFLGLNSIIVASFIYISGETSTSKFVLGNAVLFFTLLNSVSKAIHIYKLNSRKNINLFPKLAVTIVQVLLGILVISNLYNGVTMQTLILGYYLVALGLISSFEPIIMLLLKNRKMKDYFENLINIDAPKSQIEDDFKVDKKPVEIKSKKPVVKKQIKKTTKKSNVK